MSATAADPARCVIVGGNAAGMSAATRLRRRDETVEIVVFERGEHVSYASCGLPYHVGETIPAADLDVLSPERVGAIFDVDVRTGHEVVDVDTDARTVRVDDGASVDTVAYDDLVLAPGAEPVVPPINGVENVERLYTMRSVEDATTVREAVNELHDARGLVVGAGYIGLEVAENLDAAGLEVTVAEMHDRVMPATLGPAMAATVHNHVRDADVDLRLGESVEAFDPTMGVQRLVSKAVRPSGPTSSSSQRGSHRGRNWRTRRGSTAGSRAPSWSTTDFSRPNRASTPSVT
jgi:NADPH-dependent 2,4-dienoyl-CoA reductase/sulfur reductase-like enzyme